LLVFIAFLLATVLTYILWRVVDKKTLQKEIK